MLARSARDQLRRMLRLELRMLLAEATRIRGTPRGAVRRNKARAPWSRFAPQRA